MRRTMRRCRTILTSDRGAVFPITLVFSLIVTIAGMSFLSLASGGSMLLRRPINETKALYLAEGAARKGIWKMRGKPINLWTSAATFSDSTSDGLTSAAYDSTTDMLVCTGTVESSSKEVQVDVHADRATDHIIAYKDALDFDGVSVVLTYGPGHGPKQFDVLPYPDMVYYQGKADSIYGGNQTFQSEVLNGIHFVNGNVDVKNGTVVLGTIVATGRVRFFGGSIIIAQQVPTDPTRYYPAVISFADSESDVIGGSPGLFIFGLVYASGEVNLNPVNFTGLIICPDVELQGNTTGTYGAQYGNDPPGFIWPDGSYQLVVGLWEED